MIKLNKEYEIKIEELLANMTLEEKVGQLQQCGPSMVGAFDVSFEELLNMMFDGRINEEEFGKLMSAAKRDFHEKDLKAGLIGSYNGVKDAETANYLQKIAVEETRLGIPLLFGYDVVHGFRTVMPIPLAESCAWDPNLWEETAKVAAKEATAAGIHMTFAPMVDVGKDARWGRVSEGAGEDSLLTSHFGASKVKGFQSENLAACVKHFAGYGAVEAGRDYNRVDMSLQRLWEEYLPPYEASIKAGAKAVMPAFNDINGIPCTVNEWLLKDVLREQWEFKGMTISDANAIAECVAHGISEDRREAARMALEAGVDMDLGSNVYIENICELIQNGEMDIKSLDLAVKDILKVKMELGLFENPYQTSNEKEKQEILKPEYREIARRAAEKSIVMLKNENVLPLSKNSKIRVVGQLAGQPEEMLGAWAIAGERKDCISIIDAFENNHIQYEWLKEKNLQGCAKEKLLDLSQDSDVFILAIGEKKDQSGEAASRADIGLPKEQIELLKAIKEFGKPIITILFNGRPLAIPEVAEYSDAILEAWHPGIEAGNAIVNILFGEINPSAKLTMTFPYKTGQCPMYYAHINTGRPGGKAKFTSRYLDAPNQPLFPFGYGLSYTEYKYSNLKVRKFNHVFEVEVEVTNVGNMAGEEIVQCYIRDCVAKRVRPVKQLKDFTKISLKIGEMKKVIFKIPFESTGYYDMNMNYMVESGNFEFFVGSNSVDCISEYMKLEEKDLK